MTELADVRRKLAFYYRLLFKTVLANQNVITGLVPNLDNHAYIRDNTYVAMAIWALTLSYKRMAESDEEKARLKDLEGRLVKIMRSLLTCMMKQSDKVETFKLSRNPIDALHCKFAADTLLPVTLDEEYGHLQIDAVSLYILTVAQITASGVVLIYTPEEVAFIQNLVFYIETAFMTSDYGIWERGDKTNHGFPELNSTSIGMAKAALEAISDVDLYGSSGGIRSYIHVMADDPQSCSASLVSMLPRESYSKETDAGLLSVVGFPAFAIDDEELIELTKSTILTKLEGAYGCCRFLRDGYKTPLEDPSRLYYDPSELKMFENIECEWPLFFCFFLLHALFQDDTEKIEKYSGLLKKLVIMDKSGDPLMPELYAICREQVAAEYAQPKTQTRFPLGSLPHLWSQSLYLICRLLQDELLRPQELDPIGRRLCIEPKPDLVVQVVILAEDAVIQERLATLGLKVQSFVELDQQSQIKVFPAKVLRNFYKHLGHCPKLGLSGRLTSDVGILTTSKLYMVGQQKLVFTPQFLDHKSFYLSHDIEFLLDLFRTDVAYLRGTWAAVGRPLFVIPVYHWYFGDAANLFVEPSLMHTIRKLKSGLINGTRVVLGNVDDFVNTSCVSMLSFLDASKCEDLLKEASRFSYGCSHFRGRLTSSGSMDLNKRNPNDYVGLRKGRSSAITSAISCDLGESDNMNVVRTLIGETDVCNYETAGKNISKIKSLHKFGVLDTESSSTLNIASDQDILDKLSKSTDLYEQLDLVLQLYQTHGLNYDTMWMGLPGVGIGDLLSELYERAGALNQWWIVRHCAGLLEKRFEVLPKCVVDLLVRLKQVTVGLPPDAEEIIIDTPKNLDTLVDLINSASAGDKTFGVLTQEILVYMSMFVRTEPHMLDNMHRIRTGFIISIMGSELSRSMKVHADEGTDNLLSLSPFEMKSLLYHILNGKEFTTELVKLGNQTRLKIISNNETEMGRSVGVSHHAGQISSVYKKSLILLASDTGKTDDASSETVESKDDKWYRRRRIDGALNRVPTGFYQSVWKLLERTQGVSIQGQVIGSDLTREMTAGEVKFALHVDHVITSVPVPEYRQLLVEALSLLAKVPDMDPHNKIRIPDEISVESLVQRANDIFLADQSSFDGDACECCVGKPPHQELLCGGLCGICRYFYESSPSGRFGTLTYLMRALTDFIPLHQEETECNIQ